VAQDPAVNPLKFWLVERNLVCVSEPRAFTPIINPDPDGYFDMTFEDIDGNEQVEYPHDLTDSLNPVYGKSPMGVTFHSRNVLPGDSIYWDFFNNPYSHSDAGQCGWPANTAGANTPTGAYSYWCDGLYKVMQIHTNQYGCIDTAFAWIDVEFTAEVPNVFTPNGDGNNDNFQVLIYGLRDYRAAIYNRWGKLLYEWNDPDGGWDGKINGSDAAEGVYFYVASGKQASGEDFTVQGHLTLVR
jgi:gliding motility-associated-like protein